jgi:hypothetical protein
MDIQSRKALVLGGAGLVGQSVVRKLIEEGASKIVIASLFQHEAEDFIADLKKEYPASSTTLYAEGGNIFVRESLKNLSRTELLDNAVNRRVFLTDVIGALTDDVLKSSALYKMLDKYKPDIIIDSINSATAIAYQDIFSASQDVVGLLHESTQGNDTADLIAASEKLLATQYTPQLIRHVQILLSAMKNADTKFYLKVGTCGTGGMGLNIPYTHSEDKPSRMLLAKSAIAGAHTLLLFLMGRTPDAPIIKEIKPAAAIAWKKIGCGVLKIRGKQVPMEDSLVEEGVPLKDIFTIDTKKKNYLSQNGKEKLLSAPFIDTGENGVFSKAEFEALTDEGQMEFVTPEEIAQNIIWEIKGRNTGKDIVNALDNSTMGPTYRAGFMRQRAIEELEKLEKESGTDSVAFEMLGPPRLSKLLYEIYLLKQGFGSFEKIMAATPETLSQKVTEIITRNQDLRSRILSIGIPILMPDAKRLLRGSTMKIPTQSSHASFEIIPANIEQWSRDGWVDLRSENMMKWKERIADILEMISDETAPDTSSRHVRNKTYWLPPNTIDTAKGIDINIGKVVGWLFSTEDEGIRMKS